MRAACLKSNRVRSFLGVKERKRAYEAALTVENELPAAARLCFYTARVPREKIEVLPEVAPGQHIAYVLPDETEFDCILVVNGGEAEAHLVRGASYRLRPNPERGPKKAGRVLVERLRLPERQKSDRLAAVPGLSFGFSSSGWLIVYHLGAAECLQNHGIAQNPHVRCAGVSGGALAAWAMMYGCDMRVLLEKMKEIAQRIHSKGTDAVELRGFILDAFESVLRDGSIEHPAIREGRVEVGFSQTGARSLMSIDAIRGAAKQRRARFFDDSSEAAVALIASSAIYFTGLPFIIKDKTGKRVKVADGCLTEFSPAIDEYTVTIKPFCDGWDVFKVLGKKSDVGPSEVIYYKHVFYPMRAATLDHLYELGYRDMEAWLESHLDERVAQLQAAGKDLAAPLPPVEFSCADDGMEWVEKVRTSIPVSAREQLRPRPTGEVSLPASESPLAGASASKRKGCVRLQWRSRDHKSSRPWLQGLWKPAWFGERRTRGD